jgi:D-alanyl-lipoteichoic acid acyltransferase DltB (MBOAT superfamily)
MNVCSMPFLACCIVVVVLFQSIAQRGRRRLFLGLVNLAFLATLVPNGRSWVSFALLIGGSYLVLLTVRARPSRTAVLAIVAIAVTLFVFVKQYTFVSLVLPPRMLNHGVELVGLSYMLFKFIHVLVDLSQGQLAPLNFFSYANYQLAFFTLLAGPIGRYNDFHRSWIEMDAGPVDVKDTLRAWNRIFTGLFKMGLLAPLCWEAFQKGDQAPWPPPGGSLLQQFVMIFYAYPFFLYFNFSGYTDIAIGSARLLGFHLPENFDMPFLARNVIDYWNRWHMSLSHWIRDYIFMTSYKVSIEFFPSAAKLSGPALLFLALFLSGVWHGTTPRFAVWGALYGLGAVVNQVYGDLLKRWLGRPGFHRYERNPMIHLVAIILTFHYNCLCFLVFSSGPAKALTVIKYIGTNLTGILSSLIFNIDRQSLIVLATVCFLLCALWQRDALLGYLGRITSRLAGKAASLHQVVLVNAVVVVLLLLSAWALQQRDPVVVYMRF